MGKDEFVPAIGDVQIIDEAEIEGLLDVEAYQGFIKFFIAPTQFASARPRGQIVAGVIHHVHIGLHGEVFEELGLGTEAEAANLGVGIREVVAIHILRREVGSLPLEATEYLELLEPWVF